MNDFIIQFIFGSVQINNKKMNTFEEVDEFKTPRAPRTVSFGKSQLTPKSLHFSESVQKRAELNDKTRETVNRFNSKSKMFSKELDAIENYLSENLRIRAKLAMKDIEKMRNDLSDYMEEIFFHFGDSSVDYEEVYDSLIARYRRVSEELTITTTKETIESNNFKLEPIKIPIFSGALKEWPNFNSLFGTIVIKNFGLNNIQRMQYLKTSVSGEALQLISNMDISEENFNKAWKILVDRYENKRAMRETHLDALFTLQFMTSESAHELRELYDNSKECIELLQGVSSEQILLYTLVKKLPDETRMIYEQSLKNPTGEQKLSEFFEFLHKRCQVLETIEGDEENSISCNVAYNDYQSTNKECLMEQCDEQCQNLYLCDEFRSLTVAERRQIVTDQSLCSLCLKQHVETECNFKKRCSICGERHNKLLHEETTSSFTATIVCACAYTQKTNSGNILLPTAVVKIKAANGLWIPVRALIDQSSMSSFISKRAAKFLNLRQREDNINILSITGNVESAKSTAETQIVAEYGDGSFQLNITTIVLNHLTPTLPSCNFNRRLIKYDPLENLILADPNFDKTSHIDMILGADIFAKIALSGVIKTDNCAYVLQETVFGWIISGSFENDCEANKTFDIQHKTLDDKPYQFKSTFDWSISKCTNWLCNTIHNSLKFVGLILLFVLFYCVGASYAEILQIDNFTGASNFNNTSNDGITECKHLEHNNFNSEAASPVHHSLEFLQTIRKMQHEIATHRYLHVHHMLILYSFIAWILFCMLNVWIQRKNNKHHSNIRET